MNSIFIFRRDFRINDNTCLFHCIKNSDNVYPIFIFTPEQIKNNKYKSDNAVQFMIESLKYLSKKIKLTYCYGNYIDVLKDIIKKNKINSIYTNTDYTKYSIKREKDIQQLCDKLNINFNFYHDICLFEPGSILTDGGKIYQKYTPFYNKALKLKIRPLLKLKNIKENTKGIKTKFKIKGSKLKDFYIHNENLNVKGGRKKDC